MTPERHEQIASLYHLALDRPPNERAAFLEAACAHDAQLREEVESLLALEDQAKTFIESPAIEVAAGLLMEDTPHLPAGSTIGFYKVLSAIGAGGMGEVYLAEDTRLGRKIALKLLPVRFTQDPERLRWFEKEAQAASSLNHPNIITIHDIGQVEGHQFIATEFIDGQTLRQKIQQGPIRLEEAIDITLQAANALAAAHEAGVIHRDIKPENIMLRRDGYVKILDFGLAKLTQQSGAEVGLDAQTAMNSITTTGTLIGTARYMSPEQARGQAVDARSDLFSLGVVLYEMLTCQSPFPGATTADVITAILSHEPSTAVIPEAPETLQDILRKALRKDRDARYPTARAMITDLNALKQSLEPGRETARKVSSAEYLVGLMTRRKPITAIAAALLLLVVSGLLYLPVTNNSTPVADSPIDSIAVLPFENVSNDPEAEYLSDGISDGLITRLTKLPNLRVILLTAALRYKGKDIDEQRVGRELKVRSVLTGKLALRKDVLSITARLVDARDNRLLWSEQYNDRSLDELLKVQDEIVRQVASLMKFTEEQQNPLLKPEAVNPAAHRQYLHGRTQWAKLTEAGLRRSIEHFEQAVKIDPNYARAYSGLADAYSLLGETSYERPAKAFEQARFYANKALELDKSLAEAWVSLGIVRLFYEWNWQGAEEALNEAKRLDRNNLHVYHFYGHYLQFLGKTDEAIRETRQGVALDEVSLYMNAELCWAYYLARDYDVSIRQCRETLDLDPDYTFASWTMTQSLVQQGRYQEALDILNKVLEPSGNWAFILTEIGYVNARLGNRAEAQRIINELKMRAKKEWLDPVLIAYIYIALDDKDAAIDWLRKGFDARSGLTPWLKEEPKFDPLRGDARFTQLMRDVGLPL